MLSSLLLLRRPASVAAPPVSPPPAPAPTAAGIDQLAFLVGGSWVARPYPDDPTASLAETCTWALAGRVIVTSVVSKAGGAVVGTARGVFEWDPVARALRSQSVSSSGTWQSAVETGYAPVPPTWAFLSTTGGAVSGKSRMTLGHLAPDELAITSAPLEPDGGAEGETRLLYRREAAPP